MERHGHYQHLGSTRDDAAGEAFDKVARMLGLGYPGGPAISKLAAHGKRDSYKLPIGLDERDSLEFSFSGLKAAVYNIIQKLPTPIAEHTKADIAASFEQTVADTICRKTVAALSHYPGVRSVCLVGGVAANKHLRAELEKAINNQGQSVSFITAPLEFCTDNAAMIGVAAIYQQLFGRTNQSAGSGGWAGLQANPNLALTSEFTNF
jgi:N6-L-threonylcarbamoyladenine synthase